MSNMAKQKFTQFNFYLNLTTVSIITGHILYFKIFLKIFKFLSHLGALIRGNKVFEKFFKNMYPTLQSYIYEWK